MNLIDLTVWSFDGFQLRSWGPSTLWSAQWSGADLCTLVDEAVRFIKLNQVSISEKTKDLDAKASHDIVNRLTLTSVRVTHQAGCLVVRCCLGPDGSVEAWWFCWRPKPWKNDVLNVTPATILLWSLRQFNVRLEFTWSNCCCEAFLYLQFIHRNAGNTRSLEKELGKIFEYRHPGEWLNQSLIYGFRISSTLDSWDHISQLASFGFGWPNLR